MKLFTSNKAMLLATALLVIVASNGPSIHAAAAPAQRLAEATDDPISEGDETKQDLDGEIEPEAPLANVTEAPVPATTEAPVAAPTEAPVVVTEAPVPAPTEPPVVVTEAPVPAPTEAPVAATEAPVAAPTEAPVAGPTEAPVLAPTDPPVVATEAPVAVPTDPPVVATEAPVAAPSEPVVPVPPTAAPVAPTASPTTAAPTASPTAMPTWALRSDTVEGLGIALDGVVLPMTEESIATFESTYALHCTDFFNADLEQVSRDMQDYSTTITYVNDEALRRRRLRVAVRSVQETGTGSVLVTYDQALEYRADPEVISLTKAVAAPFKTETRRQTFADLLVASGDPTYENLQGVGKLVGPGGDPGLGIGNPGPADPKPKPNTNAIIIGVCAGVGGLLLLGGAYMLCKRRSGKSKSKGDIVGDDDKPPSQLAVST